MTVQRTVQQAKSRRPPVWVLLVVVGLVGTWRWAWPQGAPGYVAAGPRPQGTSQCFIPLAARLYGVAAHTRTATPRPTETWPGVPHTPTPTSTPTPTRSPTRTATRSPTPSPSATSSTIVVNGGFEAGRGVGWQEYDACAAPANCTPAKAIVLQGAALNPPVQPASGQWLARLIVREYGEVTRVYQTVQLPAGAPVYLNFDSLIDSSEWCDVGYYDSFSIYVNGEPINDTFDHYSICRSDSMTNWATTSIGPYTTAGGPAQIGFELMTIYADTGATIIYLDNVSVDLFPRAAAR